MKTFKELRSEITEANKFPAALSGFGAAQEYKYATDKETPKSDKPSAYTGAGINAADAAVNLAGEKRLASTLGKKMGSKMIPGLGAVVSGKEAIDRYKAGDKLGAAISGVGALGAAASVIPPLAPIGAGISTVADAINTARDLPGLMKKPSEPQAPKTVKNKQTTSTSPVVKKPSVVLPASKTKPSVNLQKKF